MHRFFDIYKIRKTLHMYEEDGAKKEQPGKLTESSSLITNKFQGRKKDMEKIISLLLSDDVNNDVYSVIPIVGMAGVGKTTLVQHIFKDETIVSNFNLKIWVCASQQHDVVEVTRSIIEGIGRTSTDLSQLNSLHGALSCHLKKKKFLLVLDDVWDDDSRHWDLLRAPLSDGAKGSKVIVTTKNMKIGKMVGLKSYQLTCLSDYNTWLVCHSKLWPTHASSLDTNMEEIGKRIAARCKGLPLAAEAIGVSLNSNFNEKHWRRVLEYCLLTEDNDVNKILPDLRVSYNYLPLHLKHCFAYCSLFPKSHVFEKEKLVQLWMAQGFIDANGSSSLEEVGCGYFDILIERCFFQHSPSHHPSEEKYVMHDLYHELAENVSGKEYNRKENFKMKKIDEECNKARHSSMVPQETKTLETIEFGFFDNPYLRTFLFIEREGVPFSLNIQSDLFSLSKLSKCISLRALDLGNTHIKNLPSTVGNLIHLRYLSVENTKVQILPESTVGLFNLQTLNLKHCYDLKELPKGMKLLDNLRHLYLPYGRSCRFAMPAGMGQMSNLQTLPFIAVSESDGFKVEQLGKLEKIKGQLHISGMNYVTEAQFAKEANIQNKDKLQKLTLKWSALPDMIEEPVSEVLEELKPHPSLEELNINGFCGKRFPSWLGDKYLLRLNTLRLKNCRNVKGLPCLGRLPSLKYLSIQSMVKLECIGLEFCGRASSSSDTGQHIVGFPELEKLVFKKMDAWKEWTGVLSGDFPSLKTLIFNECEHLHIIPEFFTSDSMKGKNIVVQRLSSTQLSDSSYPHLVLSVCGSKFVETTDHFQKAQTPNNDADPKSNGEIECIFEETPAPIRELEVPDRKVQGNSYTPCSCSDDVVMVESYKYR